VLTKRIIPCLDVSHGRVVKGIRFERIRDAGDPVTLALEYQRQGADEIVILDISATPEGRGHQHETVRKIREGLAIPLTIGGGVRSADDAQALLEAGADKVSINSAAVADPSLIDAIASRFGSQCCVVAIDAALRDGTFEVLVRGGRDGTGKDAVKWAVEAQARGAGEILLTSWDRDGTRQGYDLPMTRAVCAAIHLPVIASGGADHAGHVAEAFAAGADAVLAASIFHDGDLTVGDVKLHLMEQGVVVRP
jgi:imidazoleglycerol phosphate synthase cyclase subunit